MAVAVIDTNILIDYKDTSTDTRHKRAESIVYAIDRGDLPTTRVTNYVLLETLNWIHERQRHDIAVDLKMRFVESAGFELVQCASKDFHQAMKIFEEYNSLSFGDATIAAYMQRTGIEYLYLFDDDFNGVEGITRLETPNNPFN